MTFLAWLVFGGVGIWILKRLQKRQTLSAEWFAHLQQQESRTGFESVRWQADKLDRVTWKAGR